MTVAFVLSGGASLGAVQVGMLRALLERDVRPDLIVGTSVGAVNGAFIASNGPTVQTVDDLAELWIGAEVLLSRGPLADAVLASAAIPGVLPAVDWEGRLLIDGGVVDNTPLSHAVALGATEIYVLPTGGPCELTAAPRGALAMVLHATGLMVAQRFAAEAASFGGRADVVVLPPPCPIRVHPMDFGHADGLIRRAEADARMVLDGRGLEDGDDGLGVAA